MASDNPFHNVLWPSSVIYPEQYDSTQILSLEWDLGRITDAEKKKVIASWVETLPTLQQITHLRIWSHVTQPLFDAISRLGNLEALVIKWSNVRNLDAIKNLKAPLKALYIGSSTRVESIAPLTGLTSLEYLEIENFKLIKDFSPLMHLRRLKSLSVTGSKWSRQAIESLEPFAQMTWLSSLFIDTSNTKSVRPLETLKSLRNLGLGGNLPYEEYAWLSAKLPQTECHRFQPYLDLAAMGYSPCKVCGKKSMVMVTGKGKPVLCKFCDEAKLAKHILLFEQARAAAVS